MHSKYDEIQEMLDNYKERLPNSNSHWPIEIQSVMRCIRKNLFLEQLCVEFVYKKCNVNDSNFSTKFKFYVGRTPQELIIYHRIEAFKKITKSGRFKKISITEIALLIGFKNLSSFSTTFKNREGYSPRKWKHLN